MRILSMLACMAVAMLMAPNAHAVTTVQVIDTWPGGDAVTLGKDQTFYLHLRYTSDKPVRIWARPYFQGTAVDAGSNPSIVYPTGSGEAIGWFFLMSPYVEIDEVRIEAGDGSRAGTEVVATYPVSIDGSDRPAATTAKPEWATRLLAQANAVQRAAREKAMNEPTSAGDMLLFTGFMLSMAALGIFGSLAPAWGLWRWRGGWRMAAALPAAVMAFVVLRLIVDTARDPTSHNLWPFEILMAGAASSVFMIVLLFARKVTRASRGVQAR